MKKMLLALLSLSLPLCAAEKQGASHWTKRMEEENRIFWQGFEKGKVKNFSDVTAQIQEDAKKHGWKVKHIFSIKLDRERSDLSAPLQYAIAFFTEEGDVVRIRYLASSLKMLKYDVKLKAEDIKPEAPQTPLTALVSNK